MQKTLTLTLSRSTGRGDKRGTRFNDPAFNDHSAETAF